MQEKLIKLTYMLSDNKNKTEIVETPYNVTKETEKMYFLENTHMKTKQNKSVLNNIVVEHETSTSVRLRVWCKEKDVKKMRRLLEIQLKDLVTTWNKASQRMLDQLK